MMPIVSDRHFSRQASAAPKRVPLVVPPNASMRPEGTASLPEDILSTISSSQSTSFHYLDYPLDPALLEDEARTDDGIREFLVRDGVISAFDLPMFRDNELTWSFSSQSQLHVLVAIRVGETFDVTFDQPMSDAYHVTKHHFPPLVPGSGYGDYAVHLSVDELRADGFRIVSAFEPSSPRTASRLPFFFGLRVFGKVQREQEYPVWRDLLGHAVRQALFGRWDHSLLYAAFSLESFIDERLIERLRQADIGEAYIENALRVGEKRSELHALNGREGRLSGKEVNKTYDALNAAVFKPRNRLAHGTAKGVDVTSEMAVTAIKATVEFIWDWHPESRQLVLPISPIFRFEDLVDSELLSLCQGELENEG